MYDNDKMFMKYAEDVLNLLVTKVSLGTYDKKFLYSLQLNNVGLSKPITSNQHSLFQKIVQKYAKQLQKIGHDAQQLSTLPWTLKVITSSSEFTVPSIKIENDKIVVRTPFKSNFIQDVRNARCMHWNHEHKFYTSTIGLYNLKIIIELTTKHYENFNCCDEIKKIIDELIQYEVCKYWTPTLVKRQERLYIIACTPEVFDQIKNIELNTSHATLSKLVQYGVKIDEELTQELISDLADDEFSKSRLLFAISTNYHLDQNDVPKLKLLLEDIGCDYLFYSLLSSKATMKENLQRDLENLQIENFTIGSWQDTDANKLWDRNLHMPVIIKYGSPNHASSGSAFAAKIITITNNNQIDIL